HPSRLAGLETDVGAAAKTDLRASGNAVDLAEIERGGEGVDRAALVGAEIEHHSNLLVRLGCRLDQVLCERERKTCSSRVEACLEVTPAGPAKAFEPERPS